MHQTQQNKSHNDDHEIHDYDDAEDDCYLLSVVT